MAYQSPLLQNLMGHLSVTRSLLYTSPVIVLRLQRLLGAWIQLMDKKMQLQQNDYSFYDMKIFVRKITFIFMLFFE